MALNVVVYYAALRGIDYMSAAIHVEPTKPAAPAPQKTETKPSASATPKKEEEDFGEDDLFGGVDEAELAEEKKRREAQNKDKKPKAEEIQKSNMYQPPPDLRPLHVDSRGALAAVSSTSSPWATTPTSMPSRLPCELSLSKVMNSSFLESIMLS